MRILLIENDSSVGQNLKSSLSEIGYTVDWLPDGQNIDQALNNDNFDAFIINTDLPHKSGIEVIREIRGKSSTPAIAISQRDKIEEKVTALDTGADDYLIKPLQLEELAARLRAVIRRSSGRSESVINYGQITLDPSSHMVYRKDKQINLSPKEFVLLHKLLENTGRVLSREQLAQTLYGWENEIDSNAVEVHIHNLRKKLGLKLIRTIRGVGYMVDRTK
jgi:two-component system response regulator QseB